MERDYTFLDSAPRGMFFDKKEYDNKPLPVFEEVRKSLPDPKIEGRKEWNDCYWYTAKFCLETPISLRKAAGT